jgi:hypothetical protein
MIKIAIFICLITIHSLTLNASETNKTTKRNKEIIQSIFYRENIDLDAKSLKGWMRVFNSNSKLKDHDIYVTDEEKNIILIFLKNKYIYENTKYVRLVK